MTSGKSDFPINAEILPEMRPGSDWVILWVTWVINSKSKTSHKHWKMWGRLSVVVVYLVTHKSHGHKPDAMFHSSRQ